MPDTTAVKWLYPPDLQDAQWNDLSGNRRVIVRLTGTSDGTGETDVHKIDLDLLKTPNGNVPKRTVIEDIKWHVFGMTVVLEWDRTPHAEIIRINEDGVENNGHICWKDIGGNLDPGLDDGTGDILLTSTNMVSGDNYDITLTLRLKD